MTAPVEAPEALVDRYATWIGAGATLGGEHAYALGLIDCLVNPDPHFSNVSRIQQVRAVLLAVEQVRNHRFEVAL